MKIIVTGGQGFLGKAVVQQLRINHEVLTLDLPQTEPDISADLTKKDCVRKLADAAPDIVIHLAGVQYLNKVRRKVRGSFFSQNVEMARVVLESSLRNPNLKQLVFISTDMVYGRPVNTPVTTQSAKNPIGPYGASKLKAEAVLHDGFRETDVKLTIFRPRLIAGEGRKGTLEILRTLIDKNLPIPIFGSGANRYQMVSKLDVASAINLAIEKSVSGTFNLGSDNPPRVKDLITKVIFDKKSKSRKIYIPNFIIVPLLRLADFLNFSPLSPEQFEIAGLEYVLDTEETKTVLGWTPTGNDESLLIESLKK